MIHFDLPKQKSSIIKVFGIGGGGSNAVNYMFKQDIEGVDFVVCNTDAKAIEQSPVLNKIQLGPASTQGLGAGANPEMGKVATEESIQEIKSILEVNTKMAFITAGMGGGTGTGGAPIVAKICKDLGILTVGIVTTPFGFEGPRRLKQAKEGIEALKPHVDTLLVIDNDKLRMQYGNLKYSEAFSKADDVLATAAKCITDIINSKGHIIVDFADVCTVMKNGGVAILGNASAEGENRAQLAIEEALNSPLLNDNEIKGAKWVLININSASGEHECTMDEIDFINEYLRTQTGEDTDVILGMGIDENLDTRLGITVIATGFNYKDPFSKAARPKPEAEKIMMVLDAHLHENKTQEASTTLQQQSLPFNEERTQKNVVDEPTMSYQPLSETAYTASDFDALREQMIDARETEVFELELLQPEEAITPYFGNVKESSIEKVEEVAEIKIIPQEEANVLQNQAINVLGGSLLNKPSNIYASNPSQPLVNSWEKEVVEEAKPENVFQLFVKEEVIEENVQPTNNLQSTVTHENNNEEIESFNFQITSKSNFEEPPVSRNPVVANIDFSEEEMQRKRAIDRINRLKNLSFNVSASEANSELENIPAYIRQKIEREGNLIATVENYYSKVTVDKNSNQETVLSTINTFLDGKKPD
jgi:cell division protein FtsZ